MNKFRNLFSLYTLIALSWILLILLFTGRGITTRVLILLFLLILSGSIMLFSVFSWRLFALWLLITPLLFVRIYYINLQNKYLPESGTELTVISQILEYPVQKKDSVIFPVLVTHVKTGTVFTRVNPYKILITVKNPSSILFRWQKIIITGKFTLPRSVHGSDFDYRAYLQTKGIAGVMKIKNPSVRILTTDGLLSDMLQAFAQFRTHITGLIIHDLHEETSGFIMSIFFGDRSLLSEETAGNYRNAGMVHLLAISGFHIAFIGGILYYILSLVLPCGIAKTFSTVLLFLYVLLLNASPSAWRAFLMFAIQALWNIRGHKAGNMAPLSITASVLLLYNPYMLFDTGFILSFTATLGILLFNSLFEELLSDSIPEFIRGTLTVSLSAFGVTFLIQASLFGYITWFSIISGVLLIPLFSLLFLILFILTPLFLAMHIPFTATIMTLFIQFYNRLTGFSALIKPLETADISKDTPYVFLIFSLFTVYTGPYLVRYIRTLLLTRRLASDKHFSVTQRIFQKTLKYFLNITKI